MAKIVQLQYPDEVSRAKIIDDLTVLSRNTGQRGHRARVAFDDAAPGFEGIRSHLVRRSVPLADAVEPTDLPENQAIVEDGDTFEVDGGTVTLNVAGGEVTATFVPEE